MNGGAGCALGFVLRSSTMSYLDKIVAQRKRDVADAKRSVDEATLRRTLGERGLPVGDFVASIGLGAPLAVLAEFKRASPRCVG